MTELLYRSSDITTAVADLLSDELPSSVDVAADQLPTGDTASPALTAPYVLVTGRTPQLTGPMMAGDQQATHTLTLISVGQNADQARMLGDLCRLLLIGRDRRGAFLHDVELQDRKVIDRRSGNDGAPDQPSGIQQWIETYQLIVAISA